MPQILKGSADVTRYIVLRNTDGTVATAFTITGLDLQYTRNRTAPVAKVDATALAATDSAHGDNQAIEVNATSSPGLYRVDWPDAAFATGVDKVILVVSGTGLDPAVEEIELVDFSLAGQSAIDLKDFADAGYDPGTNKVQGVVLVDTVTTLTNLPAITANWLTAAGTAADFTTEIQAGLATINQLYAAIFKAKSVIHVNGATGNDTTGDGSFALPWATIGKANTDAPTPATILVYPGTYAESTESATGREWWLMRGAVVAPAAGQPFWLDTDDVSIRGDGSLRPPASTAALLVTDGFGDVRGVTIELFNAGSRAVDQNGSAPILLSDLRIYASATAPDSPADLFTTEDLDFTRTSLRNVVVQSVDAGNLKHIISVDYGYPGLWDTATGLGSVGLKAEGISANAITDTKIANDAITDAKIAANAKAGIAAAVLAAGDVDGFTLEETLKLCLAALAAKLSGAATTTVIIRAADDSKPRITATVDADGNRSVITLDATG